MEGKISSCEECFLHTDIQVNITSDRDQLKLDIQLSNIHGYPRNGLFDAIPFIRLKGTCMKIKRSLAVINNICTRPRILKSFLYIV